MFSLHPYAKGKWAVLIATVAGMLLSGTMESIQPYLPSRVPSILDWVTNISGTIIGASLALFLVPSFLNQGHFHRLGQRWFRQEARGILIVLALWPLAQIYPQSFLFGHGQVASVLSGWLTYLTGEHIDLAETFRQALHINVDQAWHFWLSETIITACGLTGALLTLLCLLRKSAPWFRLSMLLILSALSAKTLAIALFFGPENAFAWLTPGAFGGLMIGVMMVSGLAFAPTPVQRRLAIFALLFCFAIVNLIPANHYFVTTLSAWSHGKFLNFNGAALMLALCWPILALCFLLAQPRTISISE